MNVAPRTRIEVTWVLAQPSFRDVSTSDGEWRTGTNRRRRTNAQRPWSSFAFRSMNFTRKLHPSVLFSPMFSTCVSPTM